MATEKATYSHGHHTSVVKSHARRTAQNSAAFLLAHITPASHILDLGCGPGSITLGLARLCPAGHVIGGDTVPSVLETARASAAAAANVTNVEFRVMDGNALPFPDDSFDVVFAHQVLQHVQDPVGVLREMRRVCKTGGGIVAARDADYATFAWWPESEGMRRWGQVYDGVAKGNGAQPNAGRYLPVWAREAGFKSGGQGQEGGGEVRFSWDCWNYQGQEARDFGEGWVDRATKSGYRESALRLGLASDEEIQGIGEAWREFSQTDGAFIVIPNGEILCTKT